METGPIFTPVFASERIDHLAAAFIWWQLLLRWNLHLNVYTCSIKLILYYKCDSKLQPVVKTKVLEEENV